MITANPIPADLLSLEEFAERTCPNARGCLVWIGSVNHQGYGRVRRGGQTFQAHRVALALAGVPLPSGLVVDHLCRNRACVNVAHLEVVPARINTIRGHGRVSRAVSAFASGVCSNGHVIAEVGTHKAGRYRTCAQCGRDRVVSYKARLRDVSGGAS